MSFEWGLRSCTFKDIAWTWKWNLLPYCMVKKDKSRNLLLICCIFQEIKDIISALICSTHSEKIKYKSLLSTTWEKVFLTNIFFWSHNCTHSEQRSRVVGHKVSVVQHFWVVRIPRISALSIFTSIAAAKISPSFLRSSACLDLSWARVLRT